MEVLAIIPARSGSKSVADKNIRELAGKPLLAWSVEHALNCPLISRTILSTDSEQYAAIGRKYGAETPFIRPAEYATDTATDLVVFRHALEWLAMHEDYHPDIVVQLRPTYPKRRIGDIEAMIRMLTEHPEADSVRSLGPAKEVAHKMWYRYEPGAEAVPGTDAMTDRQASAAGVMERFTAPFEPDRIYLPGEIVPILTDIPECYNMPRQQLPKIYYQNASIDVTRASTILDKNSMTGDRILGYVMDENLDIDTEAELLKAENEVLRAENEALRAENEALQGRE